MRNTFNTARVTLRDLTTLLLEHDEERTPLAAREKMARYGLYNLSYANSIVKRFSELPLEFVLQVEDGWYIRRLKQIGYGDLLAQTYGAVARYAQDALVQADDPAEFEKRGINRARYLVGRLFSPFEKFISSVERNEGKPIYLATLNEQTLQLKGPEENIDSFYKLVLLPFADFLGVGIKFDPMWFDLLESLMMLDRINCKCTVSQAARFMSCDKLRGRRNLLLEPFIRSTEQSQQER